MLEVNTAPADRRTERWVVTAAALGLVVSRSGIFVFHPLSYFDADQAIFGLMGKHLAEGRAFPLFMYGQSYILAVEAWMAAPLFLVAGVSATALKLPLLALNLAAVVLLLRTLEKDAGLRPLLGGVATLPFILPAVALSAVFVEPSGGNFEPYLYVLLIWLMRRRPIVCGAIFAIGFLQREFTLYALMALLAIEAADRTLFTRDGLARRGAMLASAAGLWIGVQLLRPLSSGSGPGTSIDGLHSASNNILELAQRTCISPATAVTGGARLFSVHFPELLGTARYPLSAFAIESAGAQGLAGSSWLPAAAVALAAAGILWTRGGPTRAPRFPIYLLLAGLCSIGGYVFGRCGEVNFYGMRYELLSIMGLVGLFAWFLGSQPPKALLSAWGVALAGWMAVVAVPHIRLAAEYAAGPPVPAKETLIDVLESDGIRYGTADYWIAYYVSFRTNERIILTTTDMDRIGMYDRIVARHASEAVRLSRRPCDGGTRLIPGVYRCP